MAIKPSPIIIINVKLNNPLMGTETISLAYAFKASGNVLVKLNNPLMGTETTLRMLVM